VGRDRAVAAAEAARWAATWPAAQAQVLAEDELLALEPALAPDLVACRLEIGFPIEPGSATIAFADLARRRGVEVVLGSTVVPAVIHGRVAGVMRDGSLEPAGNVVVAAGPWTPAAVDPSGRWRPIRPIWGVVLAVALAAAPRHGLEAIDIDIEPDEPGSTRAGDDGPRPAADAGVDFSLVPAVGSSALGSTFLTEEPDPAAYVEAIRRLGSRYVPAVADAPLLGLRHCARPVSLDGRPLVGAAPWADGLWICAGHGPWGISTGAGSARLLADQIVGRGPAGIPSALAGDRFGEPAA
jgi:glycine/D-amino acid oxidase-like deaminating enzyme